MKALVVERKNLKHNLKIIKEIINKDEKKTRIIAVIKRQWIWIRFGRICTIFN